MEGPPFLFSLVVSAIFFPGGIKLSVETADFFFISESNPELLIAESDGGLEGLGWAGSTVEAACVERQLRLMVVLETRARAA